MNKKVIVITINYNHAPMTIDCVNSVLQTTYTNFQIFLVDNGSEESDFLKLVSAYDQESKVEILRIDNNCGYVGGVNHGLRNASALKPDYYLIMNNDTIIDPCAISNLVLSAMKNDNNAIVSGKVYHFNDLKRLQYIGGNLVNRNYLIVENPGKNEIDNGQYDKEEQRDMLDDIFWLIPSRVFKKVGLYSNFFFLYAEQGDYARRAINAGFKLIYTPNAIIWHKGSVTTGASDRYKPHVNYWRKRGSVTYRALHIKKRYFHMFVFKLIVKHMKRMIVLFIKGNVLELKVQKAGIHGVLHGLFWSFNPRPYNGKNPYLK